LRSCKRALCAGDRPFRWRGVTAFGLADLVADGRDAEARAFVAWARTSGFNVLRVLTMLPNGGWLDLSPEAGRRAMPRVFALAREHGFYVQAVALANTGEASGRFQTDAFLREQVREVARLCASAGNCVLEIANEPYHGTQADLDTPALMERLQREIPQGLPSAWGAAADDASRAMAGGTFVVVHIDRSGDRWTRVARARSLAALSVATGKFVVDNEPIGAAERPERNRRDSAPEAFFAQGALSRVLDVGSTFHCQDCLVARVPGPVQQDCARAFVEGTRVIPDALTVAASGPDAPVGNDAPEWTVGGTAGSRAFVVTLGPASEAPPRFLPIWHGATRVATRPGVEIWTAVR